MTGASRPEFSGLRSFLFTPGNHPRKLEKVFGAGADAVILDLEDAVAIAQKPATRAVVVEALQRPRDCKGYIRINALGTDFWRDDIAAVVGPGLDGLVLPKVEHASDLQEVDAAIAAAESAAGLAAGSIDLMPIVETAAGIVNVDQIAGAVPRVRRLSFGGGDYTNDLDFIWTPGEEVLAYARARLVHASRVAGREPPIDTVVIQVRDPERFRASAERGRMFGFAGKLCIHPNQVPVTNEVFTPGDEEVAHARSVIAAFEKAEAEGSASIQLDGYFIDYALVQKARRVLALARRAGLSSIHPGVS
jgi:citrate lyase subunit beta/citryl-CoA lyase